ncbi:MAG: hypothetical protein AB7N65_02960 [Vicinamibacterales bacterium]
MARSHILPLTAIVGLLLFPSGSSAQSERDFSGTWLMDPSRSESVAQAAEASPREPVRLVIDQSKDRVRITRTFDGQSQTVEYAFDLRSTGRPVGTAGSADRSANGSNDGAVPVTRALARWIDGKLMTTTVYRVNGMATTKTETFDMSQDGSELFVLNELKMEHGYESNDGKGPQGYGAGKDVYRRVAK